MSAHLIFCADLARRDLSGGHIERVTGWCIASSPIRALYLKNAAGYDLVPHGFHRADVGAAYPAYPLAAHSGFRISADVEIAPDGKTELIAEIVAADAGTIERHSFPVRLETSDVQTFEVGDKTRCDLSVDPAFARAVMERSQPETALRHSLATRRGLTLRLDIINKCNLRCIMCHFSDDAIFKRPTSQLTADQFKALFHEIGSNVREVILSCGDEPLTSKFLPDILRYLAGEHPEVAVEFCTNAMLMRAPIRQVIMETGVARLLFSVDAVSKKLLEEIRTGCRYEQLLGNILALRDLKRKWKTDAPSFVFNFVMMTRNIHEGPAFVHLAKELGADSIDFRHMVPIGTYFDPADVLEREPARFNYYRERIVEEARALNVNYYLSEPFETAEEWRPELETAIDLSEFRSVLPDVTGDFEPRTIARQALRQSTTWEGSASEQFATTFCARPFSEIMVRDQEEVLPCPWHRKPLGFLSEGKSLSEIFFGEEFERLRANMLKPEGDPNCAGCPIKSEHLPTMSNT